jgi:CheY-like chemotaxis protein
MRFPGKSMGTTLENALLILVVDDEAAIRDLLNLALEGDGYKVVLAGSGEEAVTFLKKRKNSIQALVTDIRLGGERKMSGWEVARHARELNPEIAVVYMSGDSSEDWAVDGVPKSVMVAKPFAVSQISTAIATLINETG